MVEDRFRAQLFLGFPVDSLYLFQVKQTDPALFSLLVQDTDDYLREVRSGDLLYYGKQVDRASLPELELISAHIYSLLQKLVPHYHYQETSLYLFPVIAG